jgi:hypothetical protein
MAAGVVGTIGKMFSRAKNNRELEDLLGQDPSYSINPLAQQRLGLAQTLLNARMPGSQARENRIFGNQASNQYNVGRTATDASQALLMNATGQGQTNQAFGDLGMDEANYFQQNLNNLTGAQEGMIQEGNKVYEDNVRKYGNTMQIKGAQAENRNNTWSDVANLGFGLSDFGMSGGFDGMFKKKQQQTPTFY